MNQLGKFLTVLFLGIPSILFSIIIFTYFAVNRVARSKPANHGWVVLLLVYFIQVVTDLPMSMSYYYSDRVWPSTTAYCVWWTSYEFSLHGVGLFLMASISIERHILIFNPQGIFQVPWKKRIVHVFPIIFGLMWPPIFYIIAVIISPYCSTEWDFELVICGTPCYFTVYFLGQFDFIFNIVVPIMLIMLANVLLIMRVVYQKISHHQAVNWRRHRKMTLQLGIISSLYAAFWLPVTIVQLIQLTVMPSFMIDQVGTLLFLIYFVPLLLPIVCLSTLPDLVKKLRNCVRQRGLNVVGICGLNGDLGQTRRTAGGTTVR